MIAPMFGTVSEINRLEQSRARRRKGGRQAESDPVHGQEISGIDDRLNRLHQATDMRKAPAGAVLMSVTQ